MKNEDAEQQDIIDVRREEMGRGKRSLDTDQERLRWRFKRDFESLLREGDRKNFESFLIAHGQLRGTEAFLNSMRLWNNYQTGQRRP
jgi:hypothetical protein